MTIRAIYHLPSADHYRDLAGGVGQLARGSRPAGALMELLRLAVNYERRADDFDRHSLTSVKLFDH
jgi:hypothetical protein